MIPSMIEFALRALLVAGAVWAGLRLLGVRDVLAQKAAWGLVLASAILMPFVLPLALRWQLLPQGMGVVLPANLFKRGVAAVETPAPVASNAGSTATAPLTYRAVPAARAPRPQALRVLPMVAYSSTPVSHSTIETAPPIDRHRVPASPVSSSSGITLPDIESLAISVYLAVCAALLLRIVFGLTSTVRLWLDAEAIEIRGFHPAAGLRMRVSRAISSPVTIGSGIVLPSGYDEWDNEKLRIVLAHERSHVRQGDFYLQLLSGIYAALFWFSPLGWWLKQKLSDLGEAISDRAGLEEAASRSSYAQILLEFAALPRHTSIGVAMARSSSLSHRIDRLLNDTAFRQAFAISRRRAFAAALLVPAAFFAATAFIRVEAASQAAPAAAAAPPAAAALIAGQSNPDEVAPAAPVAPGVAAVAPVAGVAPVAPVLADVDDNVSSGQALTMTGVKSSEDCDRILRQAQLAMDQARVRMGDRADYQRALARAGAALAKANAQFGGNANFGRQLEQSSTKVIASSESAHPSTTRVDPSSEPDA